MGGDAGLAGVGSNESESGRGAFGVGLTIHELTHDVAKQFGSEMTEGVIVVSVDRGTLASRHGIRPGDIITGGESESSSEPETIPRCIEDGEFEKGDHLESCERKDGAL